MTRASISFTLLLLLTLAATAFAQYAPPFDMVGLIQQASVDAPSNPLSGGYITINHHKIRVPANSIVQMPAATLAWGEVFSQAPAAYSNSGTQTGLAMADSPRLPGTYEAHVLGNIVNGQYIAGLIFLAQQSLNISQGFIDAIDYANGALHVNGTILKINDPLAKFSKGDPNADPRFSIDEDNPTIRSETAYPMCLPRTDPTQPSSVAGGGDDPECPQKNRPKDVSNSYALIFTMPPPGSPQGQPDVTKQAPFEVGDYITYAGVISADETYLSVYQITANVGIFTSPGVDPAYIAIDVMLQGTGGVPNPNFPQETTSKVKVEGFSTDPSRTVNIFAKDTDCKGTITTRNWVTDLVVDPGPPTGAKKGRFRFVPAGGLFLPPAREVLVKIGGATNPTVANGLVAGQYFAPEFDFIFPENLAVGNPPVTLNLSDFVWLVNGIGPWAGGTVGQLNPWPDVTIPSATCTSSTSGGGTTTSPTANAVANPTTTTPGLTVSLDGTLSTPSTGLSYHWTQDAADVTRVSLTNANSAVASFIAPSVTASTALHFTLTVSNSAGNSTAGATVTVNPSTSTTATAPVARAAAAPNPAASGTVVSLDGTSSTDTNSPAQTLSYAWTQTGGPAVTISNAFTATASFQAPVLAAGQSPATLTFALTVKNTSGLSATASVSVTVNPLPDTVTITLAQYRISKSRLTVNATDSVISPNITLTCTLDTINPATNQPYSGVMTNTGNGTYTIIFTGVLPKRVTVTSSGGGSAFTTSISTRQ